ncbi:hypothetical protein V6N11_022030 [Hibiscus sabdariffa]|uniref:Uncharacterized protein n=2 Tax=Hibiscus sabdariffa TaxID=183260 RepID=A0ABR2THY2_9ROSI
MRGGLVARAGGLTLSMVAETKEIAWSTIILACGRSMEERWDAPRVAPAMVSAARAVQDQEDWGDMNRELLYRVSDEVAGRVRREETTMSQSMEGLACEGWIGMHAP